MFFFVRAITQHGMNEMRLKFHLNKVSGSCILFYGSIYRLPPKNISVIRAPNIEFKNIQHCTYYNTHVMNLSNFIFSEIKHCVTTGTSKLTRSFRVS